MQLQQAFLQAEEITVYNQGIQSSYACGEEQYNKIVTQWSNMLAQSLTMPAFGVSLNDYTVNAMKSGVWVEFSYGRELSIHEMPFEKLLVEVKPEYKSFNVIRYLPQYGYAGRCFYLDLQGEDMSAVYNLLTSI